jgi:CTP:molybdopterin cytidylyltransferase MocA
MQGRDKLMEPVAGEPLIRRQVAAALAAGLSPFVALPAADHPRARALTGLPHHPLFLPGSAEGMGGTLRDGVAALPPCPRFLILAADLPGITAADLAAVAGADPRGALVLVATDATGAFGHPVAFDASLRPAFAALSGDEGARALVRANRARMRRIPLPADHATRDLDTPADWAAWRAETGL